MFSFISQGIKGNSALGKGFPGGSEVKASACNAGDQGSIPGSGRPPGEGNGYPLRYSCLENSTDRGAWQASVHGVTKNMLLSHFSHVRFCVTPKTAAHQAPRSLGFSRQEHWSGLPCPSPGVLPDPGIKPWSPALQADSLPTELLGKPNYLVKLLKSK